MKKVIIPVSFVLCFVIILELTLWKNFSIRTRQRTLDSDDIKVAKHIPALKLIFVTQNLNGIVNFSTKKIQNKTILVTTPSITEKKEQEATSHPIPVCPKIYIGDSNICVKSPTLKYFVYVHSAPKNMERRMNLRSTWGNATIYRDGRLKVIFVLGRTKIDTVQKRLEAEMQKYGDILQGDFMDSYHNLTLKGILALRFVAQYCKNVKYVIKSDDDTFIDVISLFDVIEKQGNSKEELIVCHMYSENSMPILRDPKTCLKWCIEKDEFPGRNSYPAYCAGLFYLTTYNVINAMYKASLRTPFFWIDDVYITGLLMGKARKLLQTKYVQTEFSVKADYLYNKTIRQNNFVGLVGSTVQYKKLWNYILEQNADAKAYLRF